jgi:hypothetical protein
MPMKSYYRDPNVEQGVHNIVLQSRAGNRLTLLLREDRTDLEFVYKPNAFRRKDFRARNFSNRDNQTSLFSAFSLPDIDAGIVRSIDYDPFATVIDTLTPAGAANRITVVNLADENAFALAADRPLLLSFRPHSSFEVSDGRLAESFTDRGEPIVSFVLFDSFEANRFRVLEDGSHVLQIFENEVVLVGGEETPSQITRVERKLRGLGLNELLARNERIIAPAVRKGHVCCTDPDTQRVIDLNQRIVHSGMDAGGACFGALNRIYYLIWVRDGAMTASMVARAGSPDMLRTWAPFLLANPATRRLDDGSRVREFLQMVGTRWTKSEDDGVFFAALSLHTHFETTGETDLLSTVEFEQYLDALDANVADRFDETEGLFGSDTLGETTLAGSPMFGYDSVNGRMARDLTRTDAVGQPLARVYTLYHNVNLYNALRMTEALLAAAGRGDDPRIARYAELADRVRDSLARRFVNEEGHFHAYYAQMADGSTRWVDFPESDYWEYAWAVSVGPFFPDLPTALRSARMVVEVWPTVRPYGYCPWNTLSRFLKEHGLDTLAYRALLKDEVAEALTHTKRFPLYGALTEYYGNVEGWRALPFSAGSFLFSLAGVLLQSLPEGLGVRAGDFVDRVEDFHFRTSRIDVRAEGAGDIVASWTLNGREIPHTLQLPQGALRPGPNEIRITRGSAFEGFRLHGSTGTLLGVSIANGEIRYELTTPHDAQIVFENFSAARNVRMATLDGENIDFRATPLEDTRLTTLDVSVRGDFVITAEAGV